MRKYCLSVLAAVFALGLSISSYGQATNSPGAPPANPGAPAGPRPNPQMRLFSVRNSISTLDRVMADLKRSDNDFDGHKQSAIDACAKAREELMAVAKAAGIPIPPTRMPGQRPIGVPPPGSPGPKPAAPPPQQPAAPTQ